MKLAVVLHCYYPELRAELDACLSNLDVPYDLFVTDAGSDNRGFDIWPFLRVLNGLDLSKYTHVLKLHTKRDVAVPVGFNGCQVEGSVWRDWLLSIVRSPETWAETKARILNDGSVGMVAAAECILDRRSTEGREERTMFDEAVVEASRRFGTPQENLRAANFVGGTMFLARVEALYPLQGRFSEADFEVSNSAHLSNSFAHVAERLIGFAVTAAGLRIECPAGDLASRRRGFRRLQRWNSIREFLYQDRVTSRGFRMVKICKIPVWHQKIGSNA